MKNSKIIPMQAVINPIQSRCLKVTWVLALILLPGLLFQYAIGMYINLFVTFSPGVKDVYVGSHILLGFILAILAIVTLVFAALSRRRNLLVSSAVGLVAITIAGISGVDFLSSNETNNYYSFYMAIFFVIAIIMYGNLTLMARKSNFRLVSSQPQSA